MALLCAYSLGLVFFGKSKSARKLLVKCCWNWLREKGEQSSSVYLKIVQFSLLLFNLLAFSIWNWNLGLTTFEQSQRNSFECRNRKRLVHLYDCQSKIGGSVIKVENYRANTTSEHEVLRPKLILAIKIDRNQEKPIRPNLNLAI